MIEGEYQKPKEIPNFAYFHLPGPELYIPSLPNWSHPRNIQYSRETDSLEFIIVPNKEEQLGDTSLLVTIMKNKFPGIDVKDPEAFLISKFIDPSFEIDPEGVGISRNGNIVTAQAEGVKIQNNFEKEFPFQWVYRSDTLNIHTGTYYINFFRTPIDKMLEYRPSIRLIINKTAYNPYY